MMTPAEMKKRIPGLEKELKEAKKKGDTKKACFLEATLNIYRRGGYYR